MKKRMLITGISGLLGNNLAYCLKDSYDILGLYHSHKVEVDGIQTMCADITSCQSLCEIIKEFDPDIVIHSAAQADVDMCEKNPQEAEKANVLGTKNVIESLTGNTTKLIYISTDLVYNGVKGNFSEDDDIHPLNYYGETKHKAERQVLKRKNSLVLRTNFFGWNILEGKYSLGEWVIGELTQGKQIQGFTDCKFSAIYTFELAKILDLIIKKDLSGTYNCASSTSISKYQFICEVAERLDFKKSFIKHICIDDFGFKAQRGKNLSLNVNKLADDLGITIPPIVDSIKNFLEDFRKNVPQIIKSNRLEKNVYPVLLDIVPYGRQGIDDDDIAAVVEVLKSDTLTQGMKVNQFQSSLCQATGAAYAVAVNSGTSALHIACLAAGISPGDEVITSPNTFVASANCTAYCGGIPVFADIDLDTYNISCEKIKKKINERTKAIIPVHFAGQSCDVAEIQNIVHSAEKRYGHKIYIIEDASHALGSRYKETRVGSCSYSDMVTMSFHPVKHITTGEGGAVLTNDQELQKKLQCFRSHGITSDPDTFTCRKNAFDEVDPKEEPVKKLWYYEQNFLGYNYRITDIQCALGISQMKKLNMFRSRRRSIVNQYNEAFQGLDYIKTPFEEKFCNSNFHLYVLLFDFEKMGVTRTKFMLALKERGIQTQVHYIPVYTQPFYRKNFGTQWGHCPAAEQYYQQCLSIPLYPQMTSSDIDKVIVNIKELVAEGVHACEGGR